METKAKLKIRTDLFEINKPSELTQAVYFKNEGKNVLAHMTATQMDLFNLIFYKSKEHFIKNQIELTEFIPFEIDLQDLTLILDKYSGGNYTNLVKQILELADVKVIINALQKNKDLESTFTRFIHKITVSRHKDNFKKKVRLVLDGDICKMIYDVKKLFTKFYLTIQLSMTSKYSKALYEILKDYEGIKSKIIDYDLLLAVLNVNFETTKNYKWAMFHQNILKKAINEINEKSDIKVSYEPIKEKTKENPRLHVEKILFQIEPQPESRLQKLGLLDQEEELSIEEQIHLNKKKHIARQKLDKILNSEYGQKIEDEDKWIEADIKKFEEKYESMINLDTWQSDMAKKSVEFRREYYIQLGHFLDKSMVGYDKTQYRLTDMFDPSTIYTFDPKETYDTILRFVTETNILEVLEEL